MRKGIKFIHFPKFNFPYAGIVVRGESSGQEVYAGRNFLYYIINWETFPDGLYCPFVMHTGLCATQLCVFPIVLLCRKTDQRL